MMSEMPFKYVQTIVSIEENDEIEEYLHRERIKNKREWLRQTILNEVRKNDGDKPLQLH